MKTWQKDWVATKVEYPPVCEGDEPTLGWMVGEHDLETCSSPKSAPAEVHACHEEDARLAAAAPEMARALCMVEWVFNGTSECCPCCEILRGRDHEPHAEYCSLDLALSAAGLSHEDREGVRVGDLT